MSKKTNLNREKYIFKCSKEYCLNCKELEFNNKKIKQVSIDRRQTKKLKNRVKLMRRKLSVNLINDETITEKEFLEMNK